MYSFKRAKLNSKVNSQIQHYLLSLKMLFDVNYLHADFSRARIGMYQMLLHVACLREVNVSVFS